MFNDIEYVDIPKDGDYVVCFKKKMIIEDRECDYYLHNKECDKKGDYWGRTHRKSSDSGTTFQGDYIPILNECNYCEEHEATTEKYALSYEAKKILKKKKTKLRPQR